MKITIDTRRMRQIARETPDKLDRALRAAAESMTNEIKLSMGTSPAGNTYTRGGRTHVASATGYPPNPDTGALRASIKFLPAGRLRYNISDGVEYGVFLEYGTETIAPRPFMTPVFEKWRGELRRFLFQQVRIG